MSLGAEGEAEFIKSDVSVTAMPKICSCVTAKDSTCAIQQFNVRKHARRLFIKSQRKDRIRPHHVCAQSRHQGGSRSGFTRDKAPSSHFSPVNQHTTRSIPRPLIHGPQTAHRRLPRDPAATRKRAGSVPVTMKRPRRVVIGSNPWVNAPSLRSISRRQEHTGQTPQIA